MNRGNGQNGHQQGGLNIWPCGKIGFMRRLFLC